MQRVARDVLFQQHSLLLGMTGDEDKTTLWSANHAFFQGFRGRCKMQTKHAAAGGCRDRLTCVKRNIAFR